MKLLLPLLDFYFGFFLNIPKKLDNNLIYEYHPTAEYLRAFLSFFKLPKEGLETKELSHLEPYETLCKLMERDGYYIEAQNLHIIMFVVYYSNNNKNAIKYHMENIVRIAFDHDLILGVADVKSYYSNEVDAVLCKYPEPFIKKVTEASLTIKNNFSYFAENSHVTQLYSKFSNNNYSYIAYAARGYTNKQIAEICCISERTVAQKYNAIYEKLGINSKQELIKEINNAIGDNNELSAIIN